MLRFDQGSAYPSNLKVGHTGKGRTAATRMDIESVQPPNLVLPLRARIRTHVCTRARARVYQCKYRLDEVRRLDSASNGAGFSRLTFRPTS